MNSKQEVLYGWKQFVTGLFKNDPDPSKEERIGSFCGRGNGNECNQGQRLQRYEETEKERFDFFDEEGHIFFTPSGEKTAEGIYSKHLLLAKLLIISGVDEETAEQEACLMEHDISDETYGRLKEILDLYTSEEYKGVCQNCRFRPEMIMDICNCKNQRLHSS